MSALLTGVPFFYRWLAIALLFIGAVGFGFVKGVEHDEAKQAAKDLAQERSNAALTTKRTDVTDKVASKYVPAITQVRTITKTIIQKVPVYVKDTDPPLPGGFRVLHDAAALGVQIPDTPSGPDAAPVPAQDATNTVIDNYGTCRETAKQLEGLQEWVREQLKLNGQDHQSASK